MHVVELNSAVRLELLWVKLGNFTMGQDGVAIPLHQVILSNGFYLRKYDVTQAQYEAVMNENSNGFNAKPSQFKGSNRPVEKVLWEDAQIFLSQLNNEEQNARRLSIGWKNVLPTEAQWEYAWGAGTSTIYS